MHHSINGLNIDKDSIVWDKAVYISGSNTSVNSIDFNYTYTSVMTPTHCIITKVSFYNGGSDTQTYQLRSSLFNQDINSLGITFNERNYDSYQGCIHKINILNNNNTYNFNISKISSATSFSITTSTYIVIEMMFFRSL